MRISNIQANFAPERMVRIDDRRYVGFWYIPSRPKEPVAFNITRIRYDTEDCYLLDFMNVISLTPGGDQLYVSISADMNPDGVVTCASDIRVMPVPKEQTRAMRDSVLAARCSNANLRPNPYEGTCLGEWCYPGVEGPTLTYYTYPDRTVTLRGRELAFQEIVDALGEGMEYEVTALVSVRGNLHEAVILDLSGTSLYPELDRRIVM
ncbi:hypothetical protein SLS56_010544 [Neofusicoccum ribis]|uniref:Uncharacterized protein n=1 Tax=Neofusicoccum ribis TaxID=45134 RepID=A0ABR3SFL1_9PEZI